jgi:large subunit ribosomal protein L23
MKEVFGCVRRPIVTEKSNLIKDGANKIVFEVERNANKLDIKHAVQQLFKVAVEEVNVMNVQGKSKRTGRIIGKKQDWKKAIVTLKKGDKIEFFEGV